MQGWRLLLQTPLVLHCSGSHKQPVQSGLPQLQLAVVCPGGQQVAMRVLRQADRALFRHLRMRTHKACEEQKGMNACACARCSLQRFRGWLYAGHIALGFVSTSV